MGCYAQPKDMLKHAMLGELLCLFDVALGILAKTETKKIGTLGFPATLQVLRIAMPHSKAHTIFVFHDSKFVSLVAHHPIDRAQSMHVSIY